MDSTVRTLTEAKLQARREQLEVDRRRTATATAKRAEKRNPDMIARRQRIQEMGLDLNVDGVSKRLASEYGVSPQTINTDLRAIRKQRT